VKTINALALRRKLGQVLDEVAQGGEPIMVTRGNRALVVLVSASLYEAGTAARQRRLEAAAGRVAEWRSEFAARRPGTDPVALVRKDRDAR
jgi:prevent-host-death family protein